MFFGSLNDLEVKGVTPVSDYDKEVILDYLYRNATLYYDDKLNVYTDTGLQIASLY